MSVSQSLLAASDGQEYFIPVRTVTKPPAIFAYSATDTIESLNKWIHYYQGVPLEQQRLFIAYDWTKCWNTLELQAAPDALLSAHLEHVEYVSVALILRKINE